MYICIYIYICTYKQSAKRHAVPHLTFIEVLWRAVCSSLWLDLVLMAFIRSPAMTCLPGKYTCGIIPFESVGMALHPDPSHALHCRSLVGADPAKSVNIPS